MVNHLLINLVNSVLGAGKPTASNNYSYPCPFCKDPRRKFEINMTENDKGYNPWHCWVCDKRGKTVKSLFLGLKVNDKTKYLELGKLVKESINVKIEKEESIIELPKEFVSLNRDFPLHEIEARQAQNFLKKRGITKKDIIKYNIGFCKSGDYANRVIIPTYDEEGNLNYFVGRAFKKGPRKYKIPPASRDIIANSHLINWNLPLIICEGIFDAMAIKRNSIPLLGKNIQNNLMKKIIQSNVKKIYIALDNDAIKQALKFCEMLLNENKKVYLVKMENKDPSDMGFINFTKHIQNTLPLTYSDLLKYRLEL